MLPTAALRVGLSLGPVKAAASASSRCFFAPTRESGEKLRDAAGPLAQGRMKVQDHIPGTDLPDPAAADAPRSLLQRISEAAQDLIRPASTRGRAYHYAEDSARAVVAEQLQCGKGKPGVESMYAPVEDEVGDAITAPRSWSFSNRTEEERPEGSPAHQRKLRQEQVAAEEDERKGRRGARE